ncbi:MAG: MFS transporter [Alphaproteobacteria bacterium]|nr:MFS transporter [Alphaproteobacteria bacterium]
MGIETGTGAGILKDPSKRNTLLLCAALALSNTGAVLVMTVTALSGAYLAREGVTYWLPLIGEFPEKALSTLALSMMFVGTMASAPPAALLMARIGRRAGFTIGQMIGVGGAALSVLALVEQHFWMFCAGGFLIGVHAAFWQQYRFAVADTASEEFRPKAVSYVMIGPLAAGIFGPEIALYSKDLLAPVQFAGAYGAIAVLSLCAMTLLQFIRIPTPPRRKKGDSSGRPFKELVRQPKFVIAVLAGMVGYSTMSFLMTATPLAMIDCGHVFDDAKFVIQGHVIAMFAPSFFTGSLIGRFGAPRIILTGALLYLCSVAINLTGVEVAQFFASLVLVGVGWNFMFVGGTTMLTEFAGAEEKAKVQGVNDFLVFGSVTIASFLSGALQQAYGWEVVTLTIAGPVILAGACVLFLQGRVNRHAVAAE